MVKLNNFIASAPVPAQHDTASKYTLVKDGLELD